MKKRCIAFILISCAFMLSACHGSPVSESQSPPETSADFERIDPGAKREDTDPVLDVSVSAYPPPSDGLNPQTQEEEQLTVFAKYYDDWKVMEEADWWGYAVTDLDQDGNWEIIASECHGTGHYTTTYIYETDSYHAPFVPVCSDTSSDAERTLEVLSHGRPLGTCLLLAPNQEMSDAPQAYPVYYDEGQDVYYYIYEDSISNSGAWYGTFATYRSFSLNCGEIPGISLGGEPTGVLLGCKRVMYHGGYTGVDCWDMYGNYIDEDTYRNLAEEYYAGLQKKEASILWIECQHFGDFSQEEIYQLLKRSMDSFSLADI